MYIFLFSIILLHGQNEIVCKVIDAKTKESLIFCHIINQTTSVTYITNEEGEFRINQPRLTDSLSISYVGYYTLGLQVKDLINKNTILLQPDAKMLAEVQISVNDKEVLDLIKKCAEKLKKSPRFMSKAYLELYSEDETHHLELLQMYYNVYGQGSHISDFILKTGRAALTDEIDKLFINLGSTQALTLLNPLAFTPCIQQIHCGNQ